MSKYAYFSVVVATTLVLCFATFTLLSGKTTEALLLDFAVNFPLCLILCTVYYRIIFRFYRISFLQRYTSLRVALDWLCATAIGGTLCLILRYAVGEHGDWRTSTMTFILWNSMAVLGIELYVYHCAIHEARESLALAEKEKMYYQLEALKKQISPHFLFNSLNALASLTYQDAEKANLFTKKLSAVYRYILITADKQLVALNDELSFLSSYLYLENIRFGNALQVQIDISDSLAQARIVPASLQLLVENALKHNIATEEQPLVVIIKARKGNEITVENNYQPRSEVVSNKKGLINLNRQYAAFGKTICISKTDKSFAVSLPLL